MEPERGEEGPWAPLKGQQDSDLGTGLVGGSRQAALVPPLAVGHTCLPLGPPICLAEGGALWLGGTNPCAWAGGTPR